jgi:hypothetical protein
VGPAFEAACAVAVMSIVVSPAWTQAAYEVTLGLSEERAGSFHFERPVGRITRLATGAGGAATPASVIADLLSSTEARPSPPVLA